MFEKEAEEYVSRFWGKKESLDRACTIENFKEGAEFGYNKANEWHYVKDKKNAMIFTCELLQNLKKKTVS